MRTKYKGKKYCWKTSYSTEEEAKKALSAYKLLAKYNRIAPPTKHYQCKRCQFWHLTTQEEIQ